MSRERGDGAAASLLDPPNLLSLTRIPLAVAFVLVSSTTARVVIIVAAGLSDYLDGWWARTRGPRTRMGELLDPVTDKLFVVTALAAFAIWRVIAPAELLVLLARDLYVTAGFLLVTALRAPVRPRARFPGKLVTTLQILAVLGLTLVPRHARLIVLATAAASIWAIADYTVAGAREWRRNRRELRLRSPRPPR
jgi:CDP-diacylglycerol--glycerol-3-phosphate 3-phosphatidyltransferase